MILCQLWKLLIKHWNNPVENVAIFLFFYSKHNFPCSCEIRLFSSSASLLASLCSWWDQPLLGTLVVVSLQLPCERERERKRVKGKGGRGRKEEGMNQNTIKGTEWPFWELKAHWLEAASDRQRRERDTERDDEVKGQWDLLFHSKERLDYSLCWQQSKVSFNSVGDVHSV